MAQRQTRTSRKRRQKRYRFQSPIVRTTTARGRRRITANRRHPHVARTVRVARAGYRGAQATRRGVRAAHRRVSGWGTIHVRTVPATDASTLTDAQRKRAQQQHEQRRASWQAEGVQRSSALARMLEHNRRQHAEQARKRRQFEADLVEQRNLLRPADYTTPVMSPAPAAQAAVGKRTTAKQRAEADTTSGPAQWTKGSDGKFTGSISTTPDRRQTGKRA